MNKLISYVSFNEIAEFRNGLNFGKENHGKGCPLIGVADFKDRFTPDFKSLNQINPQNISKEEDYLLKGDILFVRSNGNKSLVGRSLFIDKDEKALYSGFCIRARIKSSKVTPLYCAYYSRTNAFKSAISSSGGTNIQNLNQEILSNVLIPLFPLSEQKRITEVLSLLDSKIELNNRINNDLEAMAKTLFDYWFVQFDFPDKNGKPYKSSGGKMVWNKELKRWIPEGWEVVKICSKFTIGSGFPFDSSTYLRDGKYKIITIKNVQELKLETEGVDYIIDIPGNLPDFCRLQIGDILISLTGNVGRICLVTEENLLLNQRVGKFICDLIYKHFMYLFFQRKEERARLENIATGSSQKNLSPIDATNNLTFLPSVDTLKKFNLLINPIIDKIILMQKENQQLSSLRDWLLPMLMNGQVTVGKSEEKKIGYKISEEIKIAAEPETITIK